jgi:hypothetical protein
MNVLVYRSYGKGLPAYGQRREGPYLLEILLRGGDHRFDTPEPRASVWNDTLVEPGEGPAHILQRTIQGPSFTDQLEKQPVEGDTLHFHRVLSGFPTPLRSKAEPSPAPVQGHRTEVDALCQTGIEQDLLLAKKAALLQRREIEKAEIHGLLDLVDEPVPDEHVGYMRLNVRHRSRCFGIASGIQKKIYERPLCPII